MPMYSDTPDLSFNCRILKQKLGNCSYLLEKLSTQRKKSLEEMYKLTIVIMMMKKMKQTLMQECDSKYLEKGMNSEIYQHRLSQN